MEQIRSSRASSSLDEGEQSILSDYTLGDCLGRGAFGSVYRALNWSTGETVAIKEIRLTDLPENEIRVIMLEIDLLKNLNHANIVQYHGFVKSSESLYIILEFCENGSLHSICKNFGKFPENLVGLYMTQVLQGLLYLHDQGVIHRDIKGANILTTKEGLIKLADFGVATKATGLNESSVVGTPYWMAPEVIELIGATTASDIWSVGCTVIELLEGKPPYHDLAPMPALFRIVNDDHPPLPEGTSPAVRDFLMQCFQKDPNLRVSARKLLRHPWIVNSRRPNSVIRSTDTTTRYDEAVRSVQQWNEALKTPNEPLPRSNIDLGFAVDTIDKQRSDIHNPVASTNKPQLSRQNPDIFTSLQDRSEDNWDDDFSTNISPSTFELSHLRPYDHFAGQLSPENLKSIVVPSRLSTSGDQIDEDDVMRTIRPKDIRYVEGKLLGITKNRVREERNRSIVYTAAQDELTDSDLDNKLRQLALANHMPTNNEFEDNFLESLESRNSSANPYLDQHNTLEIKQYAENDDDNDYSAVFQDVEDSDALHEIEKNEAVMFNSKLHVNAWLDDNDEGEDEDPFAMLEEGLEELDLNANIARDKHARLCAQVDDLVLSLKASQTEDDLFHITESLLDILDEMPAMKETIIAAHGILPILEVLESCSQRDVVCKLLKIINAIIFEDVEIQENLCFVGGIPIISRYTSKKYTQRIRLEAANFVQQICQSSTLTLQMFISCGGLNVLVEFIEEDYTSQNELVNIGINGIWSVFELQGPTPKNDFCRLLSRNSVLHPLSIVLAQILDEDPTEKLYIRAKIINIFLLFSQAETQVKESMADRFVMKRILKDIRRLSSPEQIIVLKFLKNISMLSTTLDALQNANAIEVLVDLLFENVNKKHVKEISNQLLSVLFNLCRHSKARQEEAAMNGLIPILQKIVKTERPLKEFALPILCDMAHSGKIGRKYLWKNDGLNFFVSLLSDPYWQVAALDAIFVWFQDETARVEEKLLKPSTTNALITCFTTSNSTSFENLLDPLQKLLRLSTSIAHAVGQRTFFDRILQKLTHHKAVVRVNLLRILQSICDASGNKEDFIMRNGLFHMISWLSENDSAVLVRNMALDFIKPPLRAVELDRNGILDHHNRHISRTEIGTQNFTPPVTIFKQTKNDVVMGFGSIRANNNPRR